MATGIFRMLGTKYWNEVVLPAYRKQHPIDAGKIEKALAGPPFPPNPHDAFALGIVEEIKERKQPIPSDGDTTQEPRNIFDKKYAYVRDPRSGYETEKIIALKNSGYGLIALNVGDHLADEWNRWRTLAAERNLTSIPWARCYTIADILRLKEIARSWGKVGLIANLEQNMSEPRWNFTGEQAALNLNDFEGEIGVSTEPYMPENFNWLPLIQLGAVDLPQCSILEFQYTPKMIVDRAVDLFGFSKAYPSFATYDFNGQTPRRNMFSWTENFGIYTVDDLSVEEIAQWV